MNKTTRIYKDDTTTDNKGVEVFAGEKVLLHNPNRPGHWMGGEYYLGISACNSDMVKGGYGIYWAIFKTEGDKVRRDVENMICSLSQRETFITKIK